MPGPSFRSQAANHVHSHPRNVRVVPQSRDFHYADTMTPSRQSTAW
jgi:hypothetical protein